MKLPHRRRFLHLAAGTAALPAFPRIARAQTYPSRSVRILIGFPAGGGNDIIVRLVGEWLSERLGQRFDIENRPGAGTNLATEAVAHALPDGHTLLLVVPAAAINATLYNKLNFNFIRDVAPVASIARTTNVMMVNPSVPATSVAEFIGYAKTNPGTIKMASGGTGGPGHLMGELFKAMTGVNMIHVPYRGEAAAFADLLGGEAQVLFGGLPPSIKEIKAGKVRALAVTVATRSSALPDIPALSEFVPGYDASVWFGIGAPKNTPAEIVDKLNREINAGLADPKMKARLADLGATALTGSPADFGKLIAEETEKWAKVVKFSGAKPD